MQSVFMVLEDRCFGKITKTRSKKPSKEKQQSELLLVSSDSDEAEDDILSMAMIKEKQRDKCGSVDKKGKNNSSSSTVCSNDGSLKSDVLENDIDIKEESFRIADDIMEKVSNNSPTSVACSFADTKNFAMDICPVDSKLDGNTFNSNLSAACKSQVKTEDIISADADFSPDFMLDGPLSSCKPHKTEDVMNSDPVFPPDSCDGMLSSISMNVGSSEPLVEGIQPLTSNVINKQPSTMDAQYMQQQSQVFVFSTALANKSAEAVIQGQYQSIIHYHRAQPKTKKYLEKHSSKMNSFGRQQNPAQWLNNFAQMKHKSMPMGASRCGVGRGGFRNPMMGTDMMNHGPGVPPTPGGMNMPPRIPMWNHQGNMNPMNSGNQHGGHMMSPMCNNNVMQGPGGGPMQTSMNTVLPGQMGPNSAGMMHGGMPPMKCSSQPSSMDMMSDTNAANPLLSNNVLPNLGNFTDDQLPLSPHTSLIGVKVPDENLTPEQKLHRKEQLATLRKIGEILLPENHQQQQQSTPHHPINSEMPQPSVHNQISVDDISSVLTGADTGDMSNMQKTVPNPSSHPDWQKMQPFFDDRKRKSDVANPMGRCGPRSQGPPPPYHQTTRSASVPIAIPSPNPNSPGNATSNLSLPSPRTCSGMNSPASKQGPGPSPNANQLNTSIESPNHRSGVNISNPGTPVSSSMHLSPNSKQKDSKLCSGPMSNEFSPATSGQQSPDGIFCRSLQSLAQQQQQKQQPPQLPHNQQMQPGNTHCKEPNLMPVPSPQHIQYLNTFDGQELTIQKQPNTSLKDTNSIVSPSLSTAALDSMIPVSTNDGSCSKVSVSAPNTPLTPTSLELGSRYPGTPGDFSALSPSADPKSVPPGGGSLRGNSSNQMKNDLRFACSSPQMTDQQRYQPTTTSFMSQSKNSFMDVSSPEKLSCSMGNENKEPSSCSANFPGRIGSDNVPLDPAMNPTTKRSQFDPISSLAQMSQQLTNNVPVSPGTQPGGMMHSGMMPYNSGGGHMPNNMHMMQMNDMGMCGNPSNEQQMQDNSRMVYNPQMVPGMNPMGMGNNVGNRMMPCPTSNDNGPPKPGMMQNPYSMMGANSPRMMSRPPGPLPNSYNGAGANIQVKPNAPNTIQYLPNRPQSTAVGPRGPPSLEFLQRFSNPMSSMDNKMPPAHNMNYFPNNYPGPGPGNNMNEMMGNMNCNMPPGNTMIRGGMRPNNPGNMMRMGNMGMPPYGNEQMYPPGGPNANMPNNNCHMFMPNPAGKMPSMSMPGGVAPDATQPLPPSIGQSNNFKNSPFMAGGPTTADPNYAQQFHNFQQQLYATNTRSQMNNQSMAGTNQQYFVPK